MKLILDINETMTTRLDNESYEIIKSSNYVFVVKS